MRNEDQQLEESMQKLKQTYNEMPNFSNPDKIANDIYKIKHERQTSNRFHRMLIYAAISTFAMIVLAVVSIPLFSDDDETAHPLQEDSVQFSNDKAELLLQNGDEESSFDNNGLATEFVSDRPKTKVDSLQVDHLDIEGMPEKLAFTLAVHEQHKVSTYYPEDMLATIDKDRLTIIANFGNVKNEDAYVELFGVAHSLEEERKEGLLSEFNNYIITEKNESEFIVPFSEHEFRIEKAPFVGTVSLFEQEDKAYRLTIHYPIEMGDGFGPRSAKIVDELRFHSE